MASSQAHSESKQKDAEAGPGGKWRRRWPWLVIAALVLVIFTQTHASQSTAALRLRQLRLTPEAAHCIVYGCLAMACFVVLRMRLRCSDTTCLIGALAPLAIGVLDEVTQTWFGRVASPVDYAADVIGITLAAVFFWLGLRMWRSAGALRRRLLPVRLEHR